GWLVAFAAGIPTLIAACSDGGGQSGAAAPIDPGLLLENAPAVAAQPAAALSDDDDVVALEVPPQSRCTIEPDAPGAEKLSRVLSADDGGEIRFYPPSKRWGTKLTARCEVDGHPQGTISFDTSDATTFKR